MKFNKINFLKLLKKRNELQKQSKSLLDEDNNKLKNYCILSKDQAFWQSRNKYMEIIESVVKNDITMDQFCTQFCSLRLSDLETADIWIDTLESEACNNSILKRVLKEKIQNCLIEKKLLSIKTINQIQLKPRSYKFTKLISFIHSLVDLYDPDIKLEMNLKDGDVTYGISEEFFKQMIENHFIPKIKKYNDKPKLIKKNNTIKIRSLRIT